jgi:putative SOS response-associated peptidase YedK
VCGRFTLRTSLTVLSQQFLFELGDLPLGDLPLAKWTLPQLNICPTQPVAAVRQPVDSKKREFSLLHWGLIPSWAKDRKIAASLINARSETVAEKPAFRTALARRRCLILADGFYEWKKDGKQKTPHCFELPERRPFAFAGLWERWRGDGDNSPPVESCTIITTAANDVCSLLHERMPVILDPADYSVWLDPAITDLKRLLPLLNQLRGPCDDLTCAEVTNRAIFARPARAAAASES